MKEKKYALYISPDADVVYQDSMGTCASCEYDEISRDNLSIGPPFKAVLPGIKAWHKRYEEACFGPSAAYRSLDWRQWHCEGLGFARELRRQLPACYTLIYRAPYEDLSETLPYDPIVIDDEGERVIDYLSSADQTELRIPTPPIEHLSITGEQGERQVIIRIGCHEWEVEIAIPHNELKAVRDWLKGIAEGRDPYKPLCVGHHKLFLHRDILGPESPVGLLSVEEAGDYSLHLLAYVDTKVFVKGLYLTLLSQLGFFLYGRAVPYPTGEERHRLWVPYNDVKSLVIEHYITGEGPTTDEGMTFVDETYVIYQDCQDCIFWDTEKCGTGNSEIIYGEGVGYEDHELHVPGLEEWTDLCDRADGTRTPEELWTMGRELSREVRKQLPDRVDIFYQSYDPILPFRHRFYNGELPSLIVPRQE